MRIIIAISVLLFFIIVILFSCKKEESDFPTIAPAVFNPKFTYATMTDVDGNIYKTITIGTQTWMAENLRTTKYNDNSPIPNVTESSDWTNLRTGAYCNYNNTSNTNAIVTFGRLYNWMAVNTGKLAPKGWHVPTNEEWTILSNYLGGDDVAGGKLKETDTAHWNKPNVGATNETGFTSLPNGVRYLGLPSFYSNDNDTRASMWSSTGDDIGAAWLVVIYSSSDKLNRYSFSEGFGFSVRCVKD